MRHAGGRYRGHNCPRKTSSGNANIVPLPRCKRARGLNAQIEGYNLPIDHSDIGSELV